MYKINFNKPAHLHFIGIGGISMSGLAQVLLDRGFTITVLTELLHLSQNTYLLLAQLSKLVSVQKILLMI